MCGPIRPPEEICQRRLLYRGQAKPNLAGMMTLEALGPKRERNHPKKMATRSCVILLTLLQEDLQRAEKLAPLIKICLLGIKYKGSSI